MDIQALKVLTSKVNNWNFTFFGLPQKLLFTEFYPEEAKLNKLQWY